MKQVCNDQQFTEMWERQKRGEIWIDSIEVGRTNAEWIVSFYEIEKRQEQQELKL